MWKGLIGSPAPPPPPPPPRADLPLAAFLSAAAPPNRKCPHPQCGDGAPLHLRSFMHANGLVTLSSVRLPAGKELPDGRVWLWVRPSAGSGAADGAARRVPLSPEAACLSFAHLLSLLLDARHLSMGGLSLQRDFVRYLGAGSTLLCLHFSPIQPFLVLMPPRTVQVRARVWARAGRLMAQRHGQRMVLHATT